MTAAFTCIQEALAASSGTKTFFFRDDDAGWAPTALFQLGLRFLEHDIPLDMAIIPEALGIETSCVLNELHRRAPGAFRAHQHGFSHTNWESEGRSCEFGMSRDSQQQYEDIKRGTAELRSSLHIPIDPIFTPPWNRCSQSTVEALERLGFEYLSRDAGGTPLRLGDLKDLPISIDWLKKRNGKRLSTIEFDYYAGRKIQARSVIGIMLHHEHMDGQELATLCALLRVLRASPNVRFASMMECQNEYV